jgi:hypothetical protein
MENQVGSDSLRVPERNAFVKGWIVHPTFDICFFANLYWILFLIPGFSGNQGTVFDFWQVYYLTLPHRWITLFLVAFDPDRREGIGAWIIGALIAPALLICGLYGIFGDFRCLALVDFLWNAWHFGSQHYGILRIYDRISSRKESIIEWFGIRWIVFYVLLRTVEWTFDWIQSDSVFSGIVQGIDIGTLCTVLFIIYLNIFTGFSKNIAKIIYLISALFLYSFLLLSLMFHFYRLSITLATAVAMFHAVEYLSIVSHYAIRRNKAGTDGIFRQVSIRWLLVLSFFVIGLASLGIIFDGPAEPAHTLWIGLNLWMALVHYSVDGMIWKLRRPQTARTFGLEPLK